jgi:hypothetical protein
MKLLTEEIRKKLPPLGSQSDNLDPIIIVKFFTPWSYWTWYAYEFDGEDIFFGYVKGHFNEIGSFSLSELESVKGPMGLTIERDIHFRPKLLSQLNDHFFGKNIKWIRKSTSVSTSMEH